MESSSSRSSRSSTADQIQQEYGGPAAANPHFSDSPSRPTSSLGGTDVTAGLPKTARPTTAATEAGLADLRSTAEYRAAWDLELWKATQADRFRRQLERQQKAAYADLHVVMKKEAAAARLALHQRARAVEERERRIRLEEAQQQERKQRVLEVEKELQRMRQQLLDAQQRVEQEVRSQVRLANETIAHRAKLLEERVAAAEAQTKRAEERQRQSQEEYLKLYESFSRVRTQQLMTTATVAMDSGSAAGSLLCPSTLGAERSWSGPALQLEQLRSQWEAEHRLQLDRIEHRHKAELAAAQQRCRELEDHNRKLTAAVARRRAQLSHLQSTADSRLPSSVSPPLLQPTSSPPPPPSASGGDGGILHHSCSDAFRGAKMPAVVQELLRLQSERHTLVEGSHGAICPTDTVVLRMDARIQALQEELLA